MQTSLFDTAPNGVITPSAAVVQKIAEIQNTPTPAIDVAMEGPQDSPAYTLEWHKVLFDRLADGKVTLDEYKSGFSQLQASEAYILEEIGNLKKDAILKLMGKMAAYRYKNEKKDRCVRAAYGGMLDRYVLHRPLSYWSGEKHSDAVAKVVTATTDQDLADYVAEVGKARQEYKERAQKYIKAIKNPETLEEFETLLQVKPESELTAEQRQRYDELKADSNKASRMSEMAGKAIAQPVESIQTEMAVVESVHTKKGHPIWVVTLGDRVVRDVYLKLKERAQKLGGYYSSFKGNGAIPGFTFDTREAAEQFVANESVSIEGNAKARQVEKEQAAAERLRAMAEKLEEKGSEDLSRDRQVNTGRRARMAASAESKARGMIALARTMKNLAAAISAGEAKHLLGIRTKVQVEMLLQLVDKAKRAKIGKENSSYQYYEEQKDREARTEDIDCAEWPDYTADKGQLHNIVEALNDVYGGKSLAEVIRKTAGSLVDGKNTIVERHIAEMVMDKLGEKGKRGIPGWWEWAQQELVRLDSMNIPDLPTLRAALREFVTFCSSGPKKDPIKELERSLVGTKIPDFFPTPKELVEEMVNLAQIEPGMDVLEPSAGSGSIAAGIRAQCPEAKISVLEVNSTLRSLLEKKGYNLVGSDFLEYEGTFDRVLMNPPFTGLADIDHVRHAYDLLRPGGILVALMSESPFFRSEAKAVIFRDWLHEVGGSAVKLEDGTFMAKDLVRTTGVSARRVVIYK